MWLFYVDEFGDESMALDSSSATPALKPGVAEWFVLSAVGIPAHSRLTLAQQIRWAKDRAFPNWTRGPWKDTEIKGRHLRSAYDCLSAGKPVLRPSGYTKLTNRTLRRLYKDMGWTLRKYRPLIYVVAIDKKALLSSGNGYAPVGIAYTFLQQRLALLAQQVLGPSEGAIIVADEHMGHEKHFRAGGFHTVRQSLSKRLTTQPDFNVLLDKPVWINADLSEVDRELLQLADIVAYSAGTACLTASCPAAPPYLWSDIESCLALNWSTHKIPSGGFTIYPRPAKYPVGL